MFISFSDVRLIEFSITITIIELIESKSFRLSHNRIFRLTEIFDYAHVGCSETNILFNFNSNIKCVVIFNKVNMIMNVHRKETKQQSIWNCNKNIFLILKLVSCKGITALCCWDNRIRFDYKFLNRNRIENLYNRIVIESKLKMLNRTSLISFLHT